MSQECTHAVITGGKGDLASAIAVELKNAAFDVDAPGRDALDVTSSESISAYFTSNKVDLLVCNAGMTRDKPLAALTEEAWDEVWSTNYGGSLSCAEAVMETMKQQGGGHVIFISSYSAVCPPIGQAAYAASKAALLGLVRDLSYRHGKSNIRVNAILPGFLETKMTKGLTENRKGNVLVEHTLGRFNTCEQVAKFIRFLHTDMPHTSGQVFNLDSRIHDQ